MYNGTRCPVNITVISQGDNVIFRWILQSPIRISGAVFIFAALIVVLITGFWPTVNSTIFPNSSWGLYDRSFWENVLVEAHGLLFEIFVIGFILVWLDLRRHKNDRIERNIESLWDNNTLESPQIIKHKIGNLKRLNADGVLDINVTNLLLKNTEVKDIIFDGAKVYGLKFINCSIFDFVLANCQVNSGDFNNSKFKRSKLSNSYLKSANFSNAKMVGVDLRGANLLRAKFKDSDLESADLRGADLKKTDFDGANLRNANIKGSTNISLDALSQATNLDYLKADRDIIERLKIKRPDMKQNDNGHRGN
jgi:hypothetical protein